MTSEEVIAIRSMLMTSEYTNEVMDSTCLMTARVKDAINQKSKVLAKDIHDNISSTSSQSDLNPMNYEPESLGTGLTQNAVLEESIEVVGNGKELIESIEEIDVYDMVEMQDLSYSTVAVDVQNMPYFTVEVDVQDLQDVPTKIIDELELSDIHLIEKYILDKEEIEAQEMEECIVELPDKQEIDREMVVLAEMPVRMACEQEDCIEEEIFIRSLPELCKAQKGVHKGDIQLETPKVNTTEISELPRKKN